MGDKIGGAFSTPVGGEKCIHNFSWQNLKVRDLLKDLGVDGRVF
jgi:hypothetical protein